MTQAVQKLEVKSVQRDAELLISGRWTGTAPQRL